VPDYLCIQWTAASYSATNYAAPSSYGTVLSFVEPAESGTTSAGLYNVAIDSCTPYRRGGIPDLRFSRVLGPLTTLPDPWMGQQCAWFHGSNLAGATCYFTGDVVSYVDRYDHDLGWTRDYRALGLRNRADWIPVTDSNTLSDAIRFNMPANNLSTILSREGRTVGQAVLDVLSGYQNQAWLGGITGISTGYGLGNYTSQGYGGSGTAVLGTTIGTNNTTVASISVTNGGSGYTTAPTVVIAGPCTSQATATATVASGAITSFTVTYAGSGYNAIPAVIVSNLPSATVNDCAALNVIAPFTLAFAGERILSSVESVTQTCHPNHWLSVDPVGNIRILDQRQNTTNAITLNGSDPRWSLPTMTRDTSDTYSEVIVRGGLNVVGVTLAVKQWPGSSYTYNGGALTGGGAIPSGGLIEDFAFGSYTSNAAAKAAWTPAMYQQLSLQSGQDQGSCTCTSTTSVVLNSTQAPSYVNWAMDQLDQTYTGQHAILTAVNDVDTNISQMFQARIIANTATTSGGTSSNSTTVTLDQPLPSTNYNSYRLYALSPGGNVVYRRYRVCNQHIAQQMQQYFPYPFAYAAPTGAAAVMTSAPICMAYWTTTGFGQTYTSGGSIPVIVDPDAGTITTTQPTALNNGVIVTPPTDVQVFLPVATGSLEVFSPASTCFTGTSALIEGIYRIKVVTCRDWTDYSNNANMQAYANELLQSMCDVVLEGSTSYLGLATAFLSPAQAVQITGSSYVTGWEGGGISNPQIVSGGSGYNGSETLAVSGSGSGGALSHITTNGVITSVWVSTRGSGYTGAVTVSVSGGSGTGASITLQSESLPVASMDVRFQPGPGGTSYVSTLHLSNRRARYTSEIFVRPAERGATWGAGMKGNWEQFKGPATAAEARQLQAGQAAANQSRLDASGFGNQDMGQAAIPESASLGLTPTEQARAQRSDDQERALKARKQNWERDRLRQIGIDPMPVKQQQQERREQLTHEAAASKMSEGPFPDQVFPDRPAYETPVEQLIDAKEHKPPDQGDAK